MTVIAVRRCARAPHCRARRVRIDHGPMLMRSPLARDRRRPPGFIRPAQPILAEQPPIGPDWLYGVKHDGFRIVARKRPEGLHLWSRNGRDWSVEFAGIATALKAWKLQSFVIDGEACACDDEGWPDFHALLGGGKAAPMPATSPSTYWSWMAWTSAAYRSANSTPGLPAC